MTTRGMVIERPLKDLQCRSILPGIENTRGIMEELIPQAALIMDEHYLHMRIFLKKTI
jgi:hypothetical protein